MNKQELLNMKPGQELDLLVGRMVLGTVKSDEPEKMYSIDASTTWAIIDSMVKRDFQYTLSYADDKHTCVFDNINTHRRYIVHAGTPFEAVCKASILAVIGEEKQNQLKAAQ
jgi:hypothetical protein